MPADLTDGAFVVRRAGLDGPGLSSVVACGSAPVELASVGLAGAEPLLVSEPGAVAEGVLRADCAAWFATP